MNILKRFRSARRRTQCLIVATLFIAIWIFWPEGNRPVLQAPRIARSPSQSCIDLSPEWGPYQEAVILKPGLHCAAIDFWQEGLSDGAGHHGPEIYRHLIEVRASNVIIDLAGHTLHSDGNSSGIVPFLDDQNSSQEKLMSKNIVIRNGVIDLRGLGTGVKYTNKWYMIEIDEKRSPDDLPSYEKSKIVLENLLIRTDNVGIALSGDGNIIRNCVIESDGNAAIMMAGPNGQILNNTIVLNDPLVPTWLANDSALGNIEKLFKSRAARKIPRAAIVLHQGDGTVISGNRIEVKGKSVTRHNIYLNYASKNVRVEGNTIVGSEDPVILIGGSTAILTNNVFEPAKKEPWWKFNP